MNGTRLMTEGSVSKELKTMARLAETEQDFRDLYREIERTGIAYNPGLVVYGIVIKSDMMNEHHLYCADFVTPWITNAQVTSERKIRRLATSGKCRMHVAKLRVCLVEALPREGGGQ
jgi:hypothetical protein